MYYVIQHQEDKVDEYSSLTEVNKALTELIENCPTNITQAIEEDSIVVIEGQKVELEFSLKIRKK